MLSLVCKVLLLSNLASDYLVSSLTGVVVLSILGEFSIRLTDKSSDNDTSLIYNKVGLVSRLVSLLLTGEGLLF